MPPPPPVQPGIFAESPQHLRRLVLLLYALAGPVFLAVLFFEREPPWGAWALPVSIALIAAGGIAVAFRAHPTRNDWIFPVAIVPTLCCGIAAAACGARGPMFLAVTAAPVAWAAVLCEGFVVWIAWVVSGAICFGVLASTQRLGTSALGTVLFASIFGLVAWTVHGKAAALRVLHTETQERAARHHALLEALPDMIARATAEGVFLDLHVPPFDPRNPTADALPLPARELVGRRVYDFVPTEVGDRMREAIARALGTGVVQTVEYRVEEGDRERFCESRFARSGAAEVTVVRRDVTQRRVTEQRERQQQQQIQEHLLQSQRMDSISRLAGGVAHDFNNLLTIIQSYTDMVIADLPADDSRREDLREVAAAATRATGLTRRLLAVSRRQTSAKSELDLGDVVRAMAPVWMPILGPKIGLTCQAPTDLWPVHLDRAQIEQILTNLVTNARAAMPEGGSLRVVASNETDPVDPGIFGVPPPPGDYVMLAIADTGTGIDAEARGRLFEPFLTTRDGTKTTGLGLTVVYGLVRQSSGHVALTTAPAAGTTFRLYFPRRSAAARLSIAGPAAPDPAPAGATLLLVDDDGDVRTLARRLLEREGYEVLEATGGEEALALFEQHGARIALIVADIVMPGMSGPELVAGLDCQGRRRPSVMFMSGYADTELAGVGELPPSTTFLAKPFDKRTLLAKVASALASAERDPGPARTG